jgi:hypothetical protein
MIFNRKLKNTMLLKHIMSNLEQGRPIVKALEFALGDYTNFKTNKVTDPYGKMIQAMLKEHTSARSNKLGSLLYKFDIINEFHRTILDSVTNRHDLVAAIDSIIESQDKGNKIIWMLISTFGFPLGTAASAFWSMYYYLPSLLKQIADADRDTGGATKGFIHVPPYFDVDLMFWAATGTTGLVFLIIFGYIFLYHFKTTALYKILPLQIYADIPQIFGLMKQMLAAGVPMHKMAKQLSEIFYPVDLRGLFKHIQVLIDKKQPIHLAFDNIGFPKQFVREIHANERSNTRGMIKSFEFIMKTSQALYDTKMKIYVLGVKTFLWMIVGVSILLMSNDIFLVISNLFTLTTLYK